MQVIENYLIRFTPSGVIPAKAGTQETFIISQAFSWVPDSRFALSGMTPEGGIKPYQQLFPIISQEVG